MLVISELAYNTEIKAGIPYWIDDESNISSFISAAEFALYGFQRGNFLVG